MSKRLQVVVSDPALEGRDPGRGAVRGWKRTGWVCWNLFFYVLLVLFSLVYIPVLTLLLVFQAPFVSRRCRHRMLRRAICGYGWGIIHVLSWPFVRVRAEGYRPPSDAGAHVIVCNHRSASDPFLMAGLPVGEFVQVVNRWPMHLPVWGIVARVAGYLSIKEMPVNEFLDRAARLAREGVSIVAFPEGTRASGYEMGAFHGTVFRLCLQERVPILPVCISGNERTPPRGSRMLQPATVTLRVLQPLRWEQYGHLSSFQLKNVVRKVIADELAAMEGRT